MGWGALTLRRKRSLLTYKTLFVCRIHVAAELLEKSQKNSLSIVIVFRIKDDVTRLERWNFTKLIWGQAASLDVKASVGQFANLTKSMLKYLALLMMIGSLVFHFLGKWERIWFLYDYTVQPEQSLVTQRVNIGNWERDLTAVEGYWERGGLYEWCTRREVRKTRSWNCQSWQNLEQPRGLVQLAALKKLAALKQLACAEAAGCAEAGSMHGSS